MPTLRRLKPVRRVGQRPIPNSVKLAAPTHFGFSYRWGRDLAEGATVNTDNSKADESKPAHDKFPKFKPLSRVCSSRRNGDWSIDCYNKPTARSIVVTIRAPLTLGYPTNLMPS